MATSPTDLGNTVALPCPSLPDDVIMDIFARLPAKFVGRCRYLSRAWAATLSSEDFADRHRRLANHCHSPRVFFLHHSSHDGPLMHVWSQQDSPNGAPSTLYVPKADNAKRALRIATLVCRGLAIFQTPCIEINYLCNPSTGQMAALPEREKMSWYRDDVLGRHYTSLGLGYDAHTKKHKVVCVYYGGPRCDSEVLPRFAGCDLYVVNSNGSWRPIQGKPPAWVRPNRASVFAQGQVYWLADWKINIKPAEMVIVSFSLTNHTFGTLPPPPGMDKDIHSLPKHHLTKVDEHLCFVSHNVSNSFYDIWLLPEHGARVWNLHCRLDMSKMSPDMTNRFVKWPNPLVTINNGSRILLVRPRSLAHENNYSRICVHDTTTGDVEDMFSGSDMVYDSITSTTDAAVYEESVVSPR
ncbi:hypothetical protein ACQJBY_046076 [Aegilops geniculata]